MWRDMLLMVHNISWHLLAYLAHTAVQSAAVCNISGAALLPRLTLVKRLGKLAHIFRVSNVDTSCTSIRRGIDQHRCPAVRDEMSFVSAIGELLPPAGHGGLLPPVSCCFFACQQPHVVVLYAGPAPALCRCLSSTALILLGSNQQSALQHIKNSRPYPGRLLPREDLHGKQVCQVAVPCVPDVFILAHWGGTKRN